MRKDFPASFNSRLISCISLEIKLNPSPQCILYRSCRSSFDVRDVPTHHAARILQSLMPDVQQRWRTDNDFTVQLCVSLQRISPENAAALAEIPHTPQKLWSHFYFALPGPLRRLRGLGTSEKKPRRTGAS